MLGRVETRHSFPVCAAFLLALSLSTSEVASAETPVSVTRSAAPTPTAASSTAPTATAPTKRDPKGIVGISPYAEGLARGDALYMARDYEGALAKYKATIALAPSEPVGHLRAFEVDFSQKRYDAAEESLNAAERFGANDPKVRLRVLHFRSLLLEAKGALEQALVAWENLEKQATHPDASSPTLVTVAIERRKMIQARIEVVKTSALVRARVEKAENAPVTK